MEHSEFLKHEEKKKHGDIMFPFIKYNTSIPNCLSHFPIHWHGEMEIIYAKAGNCFYIVNSKKLLIEKGDILVIPPSILHSLYQNEDNTFLGDTYVFNLNVINNNIDICNNKCFKPLLNNECDPYFLIRVDHPAYFKCRTIFKEINKLNMEKNEFYEMKIKSYLLDLFYIFFSKKIITPSSKPIEDRATKKIKEVLKFIEDNHQNELSLELISNTFDISLYHLSHMFKTTTGMSCIEYLIDYRLLVAANALRQNNLPILNIALDVGFNNISYFNRAFKKKFNVTPTKYRKLDIKS
jgi:AraC-like DNA-binding protein